MNQKTVASLAVIAIVLSSINLIYLINPNVFRFLQQQPTEPVKVFCQTETQVLDENWTLADKLAQYAILAHQDQNSRYHNFTNLPDVNLGIQVTNNNTIPLINLVIRITYGKSFPNGPITDSNFDIKTIDAQETKEANKTIWGPKLNYIQTSTISGNFTLPLLNVTDLRITAYGYAKP